MTRVTLFYFSPLQTSFLISLCIFCPLHRLVGVPRYHRERSVGQQLNALWSAFQRGVEWGGLVAFRSGCYAVVFRKHKNSVFFPSPLVPSCRMLTVNSITSIPRPLWKNHHVNLGKDVMLLRPDAPSGDLPLAPSTSSSVSGMCQKYVIAIPPGTLGPKKGGFPRTRSSAVGVARTIVDMHLPWMSEVCRIPMACIPLPARSRV